MHSVIIILYVSVSLLLVLVIMLQPGKGSGLGAIGGGGGGSMFGARGAVGFLGKLTGWLAAIFMILALTMARISLDRGSIAPVAKATSPADEFGGAANSSSLLDEEKAPETPSTEAPEAPGEGAAAAKPEAAPEAPKAAAKPAEAPAPAAAPAGEEAGAPGAL
jgi:preprotein translocase subunit SecG